MLSPLPAGTVIRVEPAGDGQRLEWQASPRRAGRGVAVGFLIVWLAGWLVALVAASGVLVRAELPAVARVFVLAWLVLWSLGGLAALRMLRDAGRPPAREQLVLNRAELRWTPARPREQIHVRTGRRFSAGAEVILHRDTIRDVRLEERAPVHRGRTPAPRAVKAGRPVLRVETAEGDFQPGHGLSPEETRWLAALLQGWWKA